jgi:hypothetical protein
MGAEQSDTSPNVFIANIIDINSDSSASTNSNWQETQQQKKPVAATYENVLIDGRTHKRDKRVTLIDPLRHPSNSNAAPLWNHINNTPTSDGHSGMVYDHTVGEYIQMLLSTPTAITHIIDENGIRRDMNFFSVGKHCLQLPWYGSREMATIHNTCTSAATTGDALHQRMNHDDAIKRWCTSSLRTTLNDDCHHYTATDDWHLLIHACAKQLLSSPSSSSSSSLRLLTSWSLRAAVAAAADATMIPSMTSLPFDIRLLITSYSVPYLYVARTAERNNQLPLAYRAYQLSLITEYHPYAAYKVAHGYINVRTQHSTHYTTR